MNKNKQTEGKKKQNRNKNKTKKQDTKREKNLNKMILIFGSGLLNSYFGLISFAFLFLSFNLCFFLLPTRKAKQSKYFQFVLIKNGFDFLTCVSYIEVINIQIHRKEFQSWLSSVSPLSVGPSLWRRTNARNVSFKMFLRPIYVINSVDKTKLPENKTTYYFVISVAMYCYAVSKWWYMSGKLSGRYVHMSL